MLPLISDLKPRTFLLLAGFNVVISLISLNYDASILATIPLWAWPLVAVCPLFPLLLAFFWLRLARKKHVPHFLASFAILPAAVYGLGTLLYYPLLMHQTYVNVQDIGQIFWVWLYASQAWYLLRRWPISMWHACLALIFLIGSFCFQLATLSYGYLEYASLTPNQRILLFVFVCVSSLATYQIWLFRKPLSPPARESLPKHDQ